MTSMTRLPTGTPTRPWSQPGKIWAGVASISKPRSMPWDQDESKTARVRQLRPTYWVTTYWPLTTGGPDPLTRVLVTRPLGGAVVGILTVGALPVAVATVGRLPPPSETWVPAAES